VHVVDIGGFLILLAWGIARRKNPAAHKSNDDPRDRRLPIGDSRGFSGHYMLPEPASALPWFIYVFYDNVLVIVLILGRGWWRGRLVRSFVLESAALMAGL